jgi:hypothetical protein
MWPGTSAADGLTMIDETLLADPRRCPSCAALLQPPVTACPACRLPLAGATAGRLWVVSAEAARLLAERAWLVSTLRAEAGPPAFAPYVAESPAPTPPSPEWTPRRVQNLLLALGVGLLGVAAVIFVAVSWGRLGVGGRAAVLSGVTALSFLGARTTHRRGLTATGEALSLLTVGLALLDCGGAWAADLFGLRGAPGLLVAAGSAALVALLSAAGSVAVPTRALRVSAAVLGQLPLPLVAAHLADTSSRPSALLATAATLQTVALLGLAARWPAGRRSTDARLVVAVGGAVSGAAAVALSLATAYGEDGSLLTGTALLALLTVVAGAGSALRPARSLAADGLGGLAAAVAVATVWAPVVDAVPGRWTASLLAGSAAVLLGAAHLVPLARRSAPGAVLLVATVLPVTAALPDLGDGITERLEHLHQPWSAGLDDRTLVTTAEWGSVVVLLVVAAAVALAPVVLPAARRGRPLAMPLAAAALWLAPAAADVGYPGSLATDLAVASLLLAAGVTGLARRDDELAAAALLPGLGVLGLVCLWSLAVEPATLVVLPVAAAVLAAGAAGGLRAGRSGGRLAGTGLAVLSGLVVVADAGALTRHADGSWAAVCSVAVATVTGLATAGAAGARLRAGVAWWDGAHRVLGVVSVSALTVETASVAWWAGVELPGQALAVAVGASLLVAASALPVPAVLVDRADLRAVGGAAASIAVPVSALDADRLWLALLAVGVGVAVVAVREDHRWGWLAGALLTASSWVRLAESDVSAPEAYTVPPALLLLGVGLLQRRREPTRSSWRAYGPGLSLALVPSLVRAVSDSGELRPLLLGLAALAVLALGVARRLQAPLLVGGAVLAVDALVQLAPYLVAAYDAVPRWVTIGTVGLLLVGAGATYERRVQDLRRVGRSIGALR